MKIQKEKIVAMLTALLLLLAVAQAQTTVFSYQGRLTDAGNPANGSFQMQFKLFDGLSGGTQIGSTVTEASVAVNQGVFAVRLDFGANALTGANRWLEIAVRRNSGESYVTLSPREQIASSPYSVRTLSAASADLAQNSNQLGGIAANQYLTNATTGFIRNQELQQADSTFNISGNGIIGGDSLVTGSSIVGTRLGVGTPSPTARLEISDGTLEGFAVTNGASRFRAGFSGNNFFFGTTTNSSVSLSANGGTGGSIFLENAGKVGIGTIFPNHKLTIDTLGGPTWTNDGWGGAVALRNSSAIGWQLNSSSQSFGIGQSTGGLSFFRTSNSPGTSGNTPTYEMVISNQGNVGIGTPAPNAKLFVQGEAANGVGIAATGNASQSRNKGGWVKAMVYINQNGTIARCYNGLTGASTGNCGFTSSRISAGTYDVNFGFQIDDRFITVSTFNNSGQGGCDAGWVTLGALAGNVARITTSCVDVLSDKPFMAVVY